MVKLVTFGVVILALLVSIISGLPIDDEKQGQNPALTQSSNHNTHTNQQKHQSPTSHQQQPQGSLHTSSSTSNPGRKIRDTASQENPHPSLLGSQSTTEHSDNSHLSSPLTTSTESRRVREAENSYSHQEASSYDNTRPSQTGQSGSSQAPYGRGQAFGNNGYQGSSHSSSDYGGVHPLGSSGIPQSGHSSYSQVGAGASSSTEHSSNSYGSRSY